jgi:hypothetical protein
MLAFVCATCTCAGQAPRPPRDNLLLRLLALEEEHAALAADYNNAISIINDGRDMLMELLGRLAAVEAVRAAAQREAAAAQREAAVAKAVLALLLAA